MNKMEINGCVVCDWNCRAVERCSSEIMIQDGMLTFEEDVLVCRFKSGCVPSYCIKAGGIPIDMTIVPRKLGVKK